MAKTEPQKAIQSIIGSELYRVDGEKKKGDRTPSGPPLVTISRQMGTCSGITAKLLAERLGVELYDKGLLKAIVKEAKDDKQLLEQLDERATSLVDDMVHAFLSKKSTNKDAYFRYMAKVILNIGPAGGVVVGRGAHVLLPEGRAFRVRLEGSPKVCAARIAASKDIKKGKALKLVEKTNKERDKFAEEVAKRYPGDFTGYDLTLNADLFEPEQMVRIIVAAMIERGFPVPAETKTAAAAKTPEKNGSKKSAAAPAKEEKETKQ